MSALKLIYEKLFAGEIFGTIDKHRLGATYFWDVLAMSPDKQYIRWTHYGSSSNKMNLKNLNWILTEIFKTTPEQFLYDYTTYSEWKKVNNCYIEGD